MARDRIVHRCTECGSVALRWSGRCPSCDAWNTLVEETVPADKGRRAATAGHAVEAPRPIADVDTAAAAPRATGLAELDRVMTGGLVPGSVTLVGGEPGIGKSTLLLQAVATMAATGIRALLVSAEESAQQVRLRAERLGALLPGLWLLSDTSLPNVLRAIADLEPDVVVVDSIQTVLDPELGSTAGTVTQVRECASQLLSVAKTSAVATVLVGHVTKDGTLAGPRVLEHVVDTVLSFEGERHHALRLLRATKHRFGPTGELGLFEMAETGLAGIADPSQLLLGDRQAGVPGGVVLPTMEGQRPLLVELQALVAPTKLPMPRRSAQGLDAKRLALLLAVIERRLHMPLAGEDVFASVAGGVRVVEPAADLALGLALASAVSGRALPPDLVACGEVGLGGEVRQVAQLPRRLAEAARLGFGRAVVPASGPGGPGGMETIRVSTLAEAVEILLARQPRDTAGPGGRPTDTAGPGGRPTSTAGPGGRPTDTAGPGGRPVHLVR
ncbi:MAG: DNA repair protein RadA [Actinobacteria bacterium]|nr:MAG: DNA repair protein RadA [Actinomycetota bacterium]